MFYLFVKDKMIGAEDSEKIKWFNISELLLLSFVSLPPIPVVQVDKAKMDSEVNFYSNVTC